MDALSLFPAELRDELRRCATPSPSKWDWAADPIRERHVVFDPDDTRFDAHRRAWCAAIETAAACGLLDDDLRERLRSRDDDAFRGAIAECLVSRFFAERGLDARPRPRGRGDRRLDMSIHGHGVDANVEVKAPYVPSTWNVVVGGDGAVLRDVVEKAGAQLPTGTANIVAIVPILRTPVWMHRDQLRDALVGQPTIVVPVALADDVEVPGPYPGFRQDGKLARLRGAPGQERTDLTRVSAAFTIEHEYDAGQLTTRAVVVHNPFAALPFPDAIFDPHPQWIRDGDDMYWIPPRRPA